MMKKMFLFFIILFYPIIAFSAIDERRTDVYFANGIMNEKEDADKIKA